MTLEALIESTVAGRYRVVGRIAAGGMGEVYRAEDTVLGREVALKVLHPQFAGDRGFVDRFRREARAAAILNHPNIVGVYDWGLTEGTYFMVMEYVRGHNLRTLLSEYGRLQPLQVVEIAAQVLSALDHAHGHGIVHRDVKPENILIARDGTVKVADFGLARAFADASISQAEGTVTGTVQYLAPEQIQGDPADPRTDLYATGVVMFELLTGKPPFSGETSVAIAYKHLTDRVPAPSSVAPGVPVALDRVVLHATEKERERRPASARSLRDEAVRAGANLPPATRVAELAADLPAAEVSAVESSRTVTIPRAESRAARRRRRLVRTFVAVLVLVALGVSGWATWTYAIPHYRSVPKGLTDLSVEEATRRLEAAGFAVSIGPGRFSTSVDTGLIITTQPPPGARIREGDTVLLVQSKGPQILPVPDVRNKTQAMATQILKDNHFLVTPTEAWSDRVPIGDVISQSPSAGQQTEAGSAVTIVISRGPAPVKIPDVSRMSAAEATATLQDAGLTVSGSTEQFSTTVQSGQVIGTTPPIGTTVHRGDTVSLIVSKGPRTFPMPSVIGMKRDAAVAELQGLGLVVEVHQIPGSSGDTVVSQVPKAGTTVQQGDTVKIFLV